MADRETSARGLVGPLEYDVLRALWARAPASVGQVRSRLNAARAPADALAHTTVMTVLSRLHDKGLVDRARRGRGYDYTPRFDEPDLVAHLSRTEIADLLDRYGEVAVAQFAAVLEDADPDLVARVRRLAEGGDG